MKTRSLQISIVFLMVLCSLKLNYSEEINIAELSAPIITDAVVRVHPRTGNEYVSIRSVDHPEPRYEFQIKGERYSRPDYAMLSPDVRSRDIEYYGPVSDRTKIYVLAASLAVSGIAAGAIAQAGAASAAASGCVVSTGSTGGAAYATAGVVLGTASVATPLIKAQPDQDRDDFIHESRIRVLD